MQLNKVTELKNLEDLIQVVKSAQRKYAGYSQEEEHIFYLRKKRTNLGI